MAGNDDAPQNEPPTTNVGGAHSPVSPTPGVTGRATPPAPAAGAQPTPFEELSSPQASSSGRPTMLIAGAAALLAVLVVALVVVLGGGDDDPDAVATTQPDEADSSAAPSAAPQTTTGSQAEATPDDLARSVVQILAVTPDGTCTGSGTIIDASGVILTNSHVTARTSQCPWEELLVATVDTPELPPQVLFTAAVVADDPTLDLSVVRLTGRIDGEAIVPNFPAIEIGDSSDLVLGDRLKVLGFPGIGGDTITFTEGSISGFVEQPGLGVRSWIKTDTTIAGGNSGGLAADTQGRIVGIPTRAGTDDLDITDCRRVEDTNGDGTIDENDSCIPIGGFINGIRPINLAAEVIAAGLAAPVPPPDEATATTAPPPPSTDPPPTTSPAPEPASGTFALDPRFSVTQTDGLPDPEIFVVGDGTTRLCLTWEYGNFPSGAPFTFGWNINGTVDQGSVSSGTNQGAVDGQFFGCVTNDAGLAPGLYEAVWNVDGETVFVHGVYVGGGRAPVTIGLQNDTTVDICAIRWAPVDAVSAGIPLNTLVIAPGERFEIVLAAGVYRTVVQDCDGNVIFEDPGTDFSSDLTLALPL